MNKSNSQGAGSSGSAGPGSFLRHNREFALIYFERDSLWKFLEPRP